MDAIWAPVIASGIGGLLGAAGGVSGSLITLRSARLREYEQHQRQLDAERAERLRQTYLDMADHVNLTEAWIDMVTDERVQWSDLSGGWKVHEQSLSARAQLYCPSGLASAWERYERYIGQVIDSEVGKTQPGRPAYVDLDYKLVAAVNESVQKLRVALRSAADELP
jgi:hypothetical protein